MKNFHTRIAFIWLVVLACIPPIDFFVNSPPTQYWFVLVLVSAFAGLYTIFLRTDWKIKVAAIGSLLLCFYSESAPISFTSYVSVVLCCYFYINGLKIEAWPTIFKALQTLMFLNVILILTQALGCDNLLNFGKGVHFSCYGVIGSHMQLGSFMTVLSACLLPFSTLNVIVPFLVAVFCHSTWTFLSAGVGLVILIHSVNKNAAAIVLTTILGIWSIWSIGEGKFHANMAFNGRVPTWEHTLQFAMKKPWTGWGPGQFKMLAPALTTKPGVSLPYKDAHNVIVELIFETGIPFTLFVISWVWALFYRLWRAKETVCVAGLAMICCDGMVHFPDRMIQGIGLIIFFLAYCEVRLRVIIKP